MRNNYLSFLKSGLNNFKLASILVFLLGFGWSGFGQTTLAVGDISIVGYNSANPDKIAFVLLKDITANTIINFTDNGFTAPATPRTGEGFLTYTAPSNQPAGTVISWTNGQVITGTGWNSSNPTNFALNAAGDQLFAFQGNTANWSTLSGITLLWGGNFGTALSSTTSASNTVQPTALTGSAFINLPLSTFANTYFANGSTSTTSVTISNTASNLFTLLGDASKWFGTAAAIATFPTYSITVTTNTPTITPTGTLTQVNTIYGTASTTPTTFSVSGTNLTNDILITPPAGYEISKTVGGASGYASTQTLTQSSGTVPNTAIYVRLKADATVAGSPYAGNIVLSSTGATSVNVATISSSVTPKALTITGLSADNKVYDGSTTASLSGTPAYNGLVNAETFSVSGTAIASFATATVGNGKTVSVSGYTAPSTNYMVSQPALSANITPAPLTVASPIASNKVYDGNNSATITGTLTGVIGSETVTLIPSGTFSQTGIGTALTVTSTSVIGGIDAGNYSLTQPTGLTADITVKPLTITGLTANNKVFDGNTTATLSGTATLNGIVSGEESNVTLTGTSTATFAQSAVGTGIAVTVAGYSLMGSASGNYTVSQPTGLTADITNAPTPVINSTLTALATYGVASTSYFITATNSPTSFNATGLPTGLNINISTGEISGTPTDVAGSPFLVTISATNTGGNGTATLVYTINPKALTIASPSIPNKVYDRTNAATISGTLTGLVGTDVVTLNGTGTFSQISVGSGLAVTSTSTLGGADAAKYILTQPTGLTGEIVVKPLTVSGAIASNKVYDGNSTATLTGATLNGIISPDVVTLTGGATFASVDVANNISINTSSLTLGGSDAGNYIALPIVGLTANITPKPLTISGLTINNKVYNGTATATLTGTAMLSGIIGTDDVSISGTPTANFNDKNIGTAKPVTIAGYNLTGTQSGNYSVSQPTGLTANITPLALTVSNPVAQNKVFDGNTNATITGTLSGVISPDVVTFVGTGTFASSAVGNSISVTSTSTLGGAGAGNYTLTQPTGLTANITSAATLTEVILPQFIQGLNGTNTNRIPFAYRVTISNLLPNATYRFINSVVIGSDALTSGGAGNAIFPSAGTWMRSSGPSLSSAGNYGEFLTDAAGSFTGWFITEPTGNATRFLPGTNIFMRIILNDGAGGTSAVTRLTTTNSVKVINTVASAGANNGTGLRGNSGATPKNFVLVYDNETGTGRPLSGSFIESDGTANTTTNSYSSFYGTNVDGVNGAYGLIIPNTNANGVRRIEQRDFTAGAVVGCVATDADGIWASGANTVNPSGGTTAIAISLTDAPLNTCVVTNIPPTILMDVSTTSNYVDGGITTSPAGSFATSGVLNDPTDPAKNFGIDFTIGDTETPVGSLMVTATSLNQTVVPNANLNLTGSGSSRNLKITSNGEGFSTINVTVKDGTDSTTFIINYASSIASTNISTTRFHTGTSDASTAQVIDNNLMFVADDENQALRLYNRQNSGLPVNSFDFTSSLGLTDLSGGLPREVDIEASSKVGNRIYWMGSHSNSSSGGNRPNRYRFFATDISGTGNTTTLSYVGRYDNLKTDLLAWDANNGHGLGANFLGLTASSATGIAPEISDGSGFNIEGFEIVPNNTTAYICFRAPLQTTTTRTKALIIPLTNFGDLVSGNPTSTPATFGSPIQLDLGGRAIREMKKNASGEYLIIAGPNDGATGIAPKDFRFYTWTGNPNEAPILRSANLIALNSGGSFESIVDLPSPLLDNSNLQVSVDNGDAIFYGNGVIAKDLPQKNHKKFRSELINLGGAAIAISTISGTNFCENAQINIPFTTSETFNSGNVFTAQLSDASGSFANAVSIGTLSGTVSGTINAIIPTGTASGSGYRVRIISSNSAIVGADNGTNLTINNCTPTATIKSITTGIWESTTTWDLGRIPQAGDLVIIDQNHEVTLNGNGIAKKIEYQGTGKLKLNSALSTLNTGL